jgi:RNA polymerase-binding transcription factor DksA
MDPQHARGRLDEERARLESIRTSMDDGGTGSEQEELNESTQAQHQADIGTETFTREVDLSVLESVEAELADVEHALQRIDNGSYGVCEACGKPIGDDRLEALPAARFCLQDQHLAESEYGRPQAQ